MIDFGIWQGRLGAVIRLHHQHRSGDRRERSLIQHRCTSFPNAARLTFSATGICSEKPGQLSVPSPNLSKGSESWSWRPTVDVVICTNRLTVFEDQSMLPIMTVIPHYLLLWFDLEIVSELGIVVLVSIAGYCLARGGRWILVSILERIRGSR
jgi:hypothetical protein